MIHHFEAVLPVKYFLLYRFFLFRKLSFTNTNYSDGISHNYLLCMRSEIVENTETAREHIRLIDNFLRAREESIQQKNTQRKITDLTWLLLLSTSVSLILYSTQHPHSSPLLCLFLLLLLLIPLEPTPCSLLLPQAV